MKNKPCIIEGCNNPRWSKGLCVNHDKVEHPEKYSINPKSILESCIKEIDEMNMAIVKAKSSDISKTKQKPIKHISDKQKVRLKEYRKLRDEYMGIYTICEFKGCCKPSEDLHHIKSREYHLCDTDVFMAVCRTHHNWIHENDSLARELGYLKSSI